MLLILGGIETNPGPGLPMESSELSPFNHVSVNDIISKCSYSAYIKSSFGTRLCMNNETEVENVSYILDISEESLNLTHHQWGVLGQDLFLYHLILTTFAVQIIRKISK
jgi:hypothetical protein